MTSPPESHSATNLFDVSPTNNFSQCLGSKFNQQKSTLTLFDIGTLVETNRIVVRHGPSSFIQAPFTPYGPRFQLLCTVQNQKQYPPVLDFSMHWKLNPALLMLGRLCFRHLRPDFDRCLLKRAMFSCVCMFLLRCLHTCMYLHCICLKNDN